MWGEEEQVKASKINTPHIYLYMSMPEDHMTWNAFKSDMP